MLLNYEEALKGIEEDILRDLSLKNQLTFTHTATIQSCAWQNMSRTVIAVPSGEG